MTVRAAEQGCPWFGQIVSRARLARNEVAVDLAAINRDASATGEAISPTQQQKQWRGLGCSRPVGMWCECLRSEAPMLLRECAGSVLDGRDSIFIAVPMPDQGTDRLSESSSVRSAMQAAESDQPIVREPHSDGVQGFSVLGEFDHVKILRWRRASRLLTNCQLSISDRRCSVVLVNTGLPQRYPVSIKGVVIRDGMALLLKNERDEWELPGGKIEPGESPEECVAREIGEEAQWKVSTGPILDSWIYYIEPADRHVFIVTYGCYTEADTEPVPSSEHREIGLFERSEVANLPMPEGYRKSIMNWFAQVRATGTLDHSDGRVDTSS